MEEIWKDIEGYEGHYRISNLGRVMSLCGQYGIKEKILKPYITSDGYVRINLGFNKSRKKYLTHRLIAEAFIPNPHNKKTVNHKDGNRKNNNIENLEWCTLSENIKHAFITNLKNTRGDNHPGRKLSSHIVEIIRNSNTISQKELADIFNVTNAHINRIILRKSWNYDRGVLESNSMEII